MFTHEHNSICDRLKADNPRWSDDELYARARLINAALMAKIHTVEWTPAIIAHPTTKYAMRANWYGILGKRLGKRSSNEVLGGIPGSPTDHHGVPYSLTEEFVAVYRMHPLLPDDFTFRSIETDEVLQERTFRELGALDTRARLDEVGFVNSFYSLGIAHPGAITLHNYPRFLQEFKRPDGTVVDLAATDVLRIRERGVPRYNEFRRLFHLKPAATFEELTDNPEWAKELQRVYGDVERVDLMVGLYAEPLPKGFGFSDTAFRVFILMASRRLKSDRFFTSDYNAETYTQAGLDWIDETTMIDVLKRHYPELEPALRGVDNAFAPWTRTGGHSRRRLVSPCGRARSLSRDRDPGHRHARAGHGADDPERPARRLAWRRCDGARDRVRDRVLDGRGERRPGGAARRLRAGLRRAQARRGGLPRLPRPAGAAPGGPRRAPRRRRRGPHARSLHSARSSRGC